MLFSAWSVPRLEVAYLNVEESATSHHRLFRCILLISPPFALSVSQFTLPDSNQLSITQLDMAPSKVNRTSETSICALFLRTDLC